MKLWWKFRLRALRKREARWYADREFFVKEIANLMSNKNFSEQQYMVLEGNYRSCAGEWIEAKRKREAVEARLGITNGTETAVA